MDPQSLHHGYARDAEASTLGDVLHPHATRALDTEAEWLALVRDVGRGDARALQTLYARAHRCVFTLGFRITDDRETAEEVTVDVFHEVWRRASSYDPGNGPVLGWIMNLARSRAVDRRRFDHRRRRDARAASGASADLAGGDARDSIQDLDEEQRVRRAMQALTDAERRAIEVAFFSGLTHAETAARLGEPLGTVKSRIRSGLDKLRRTLARGDDR